MSKTEVFIKGQKVDLYDDENISVISSVQNIDDISRSFNDFSQSFTVPASPNNNQILGHFYNPWLKDFDLRIRHEAWIDVGTFPFKRGTVRLEGCVTENNQPVRYKLTFFGQLIDLKEVIGDDYLTVLPLTQYDIPYNSAQVITGMTAGFVNKDYVFPLISTERQWFYNSNASVTTQEERLANIAWNGSPVDHGLVWTSLRPALKIMRIIEAIELHYGLTFSRNFFDTTVFDDLYLWLANQDSEEALKNKVRVTDYENVTVSQPAIGSFDNATGAYNPTTDGASKIRNIIIITESSDGVVYTIQLLNGDQVLAEQVGTGQLKIDYDTPGGLQPGASLYARIVVTAAKNIDLVRFEIDELSDDEVLNAVKQPFSIAGSTAQTVDFLPSIKVIDFINSLNRLYNLVVVPDSSTEFDFDTLDAWYAKGKIIDINKYVNPEEIPVDRPTIYREISFNFQSPETILADQFKRTNNVGYGDLETKLKSADGTTLDGTDYPIDVDFEQIVYEKLLNLNDNSPTNIVYGLSLNRSLSPVVPEPHLLYIRKESVSSNPISVIQDTGAKTQVNGNVFMPSHAKNGFSTTFGSEIDEHTGAAIQGSLFENFYKDYITDSFSIHRRKFEINAKLPEFILNEIKLNDRLLIGDERYIINQMTANLTTGVTKLELLNDIYNLESSVIKEPETPPDPTPPITPPIPGARSFSISSTGLPSQIQGCTLTANITKYWDGTEGHPTLNDTIWNESNRTTKFNGNWLYYKIANNLAIQITNTGIVSDVYDCTGGAPQ